METPPPDPSWWGSLFSHRPAEVWAALFGGSLFAFQKSGAASRAGRYIEAGISGLIGYSIGPDAARYANISPEISAFLLAAVGYALIDGVRAVVLDRSAIKEMLLKLLGGSNGKGSP